MWEQLCTTDPSLRYLEDIELFAKYWDCHQFMHFMMSLREDFEPILQQKWTMVTKPFVTICPYFVTEYIW